MRFLALSIPGYGSLQSPAGIPTGGIGTVDKVIRLGVQLLLIAVVLLALFFLIYSGIQWTMSGGDKEAMQKAKNRLTYSLIGLIVALLAFFIINFLSGIFNIKIIQ